ncbi:hypothetical protein A3I18_00960 [Candidatus Campbellbacteria bacterium RIFCSPLOWO2_02_FULL_35_11]|uniref:Uncharacterized protein n=1 Tax=Candidatus Campbellbacteria bacterium RIFCSPLOWO2_02_FULL_35_11 TaxID=1797581 RepID=A0A1F5ESP2_9BACT|nr:MAG: hypothetical protein A3I18_00960 [Candidatus Campbellbacteria bacterium RIFCSPLOWO2_02_FULL_35_11]
MSKERNMKKYMILVDETKAVEELVTEGMYDQSSDDVTSVNFPQPNPKREERETALFHSGAEMDKAGYWPGTIHDLLGFGIAQPDLQREFSIIALGSVCLLYGNRRYVAGLCEVAGGRRISLVCFDTTWGARCRFLGVRK